MDVFRIFQQDREKEEGSSKEQTASSLRARAGVCPRMVKDDIITSQHLAMGRGI